MISYDLYVWLVNHGIPNDVLLYVGLMGMWYSGIAVAVCICKALR
jgi:hypothetical protein